MNDHPTPADDELTRRLRAAYDPVLDEPVPDRLLAALQRPATPKVVDLAAAREQRAPRRLGGWPTWMGMAASVALGVFVGQRLLPAAAQPAMVAAEGGRWVATAQLAESLDTRTAQQAAGAPVQLGVSFLAKDGGYCRSFSLPADAMAGLACRRGAQWELQVLARAEAAGGTFRQAGSAMPPAVLQAIDQRVATPLDAAGEQQAMQRRWAPVR
ncbi:NepR family anti-sigma factor [Ideonella sp. BN130291]|uniref:NepR family anti-sigma factor n=1 Tax=Ideonella sp. BN130291 TaxID=3112940 RepID=UPI002E254739|nr:NepR family anti-sigma factor [Ideonella sp. BN130291]